MCAAYNIQLLTLIIDLCVYNDRHDDRFTHVFIRLLLFADFLGGVFSAFCFDLVSPIACLLETMCFRNRIGKHEAHWQRFFDVLMSVDCLTIMTSRALAILLLHLIWTGFENLRCDIVDLPSEINYHPKPQCYK